MIKKPHVGWPVATPCPLKQDSKVVISKYFCLYLTMHYIHFFINDHIGIENMFMKKILVPLDNSYTLFLLLPT